ncbi:MAG: hypothetical protein AAGC44_05240 [Planctomycetota bacterium]
MAKQADTPAAYGATVYAEVAVEYLGEALHRLEYHADVHVVSQGHDKLLGRYVLGLRSDRFPRHWNRRDVTLQTSRDDPGLTFKLR